VHHPSDQTLLRAYGENRSEEAFAELVRRYVDFVYSAAKRMVRDAHTAEDVTQSVFLALAKDARKLTRHPVLAGWLHGTSRNLAANAVRADVRRRMREHQAMAMNALPSGESAVLWEQIAPQLDAALGELGQNDRDALLLRYFQNKSVREVAQILDTTEDAAQKRVNRAVERLRKIMTQHGVAAGVAGMEVSISAHAMETAPNGLAAASSTAALKLAPASVTGFMKTPLQKLFATMAIGSVAAVTVYVLCLQGEIHSLRQQLSALTAQLEQANRDRDDASNRAAELAKQNEAFRNNNELAKLRAELSRLRDQASNAPLPAVSTIPYTPLDTNVQVEIVAKIASLDDAEFQALGLQWTPDADGFNYSQLTADQYVSVTNAFSHSPDGFCPSINTPRVTLLSGREAIMVSDVPLPEVTIPSPPTTAEEKVDNDAAFAAEAAANGKISARITMRYFPIYSADDGSIELSVTTELRRKGLATDVPANLQISKKLKLQRSETIALEQDIPMEAWPTDYTNVPETPQKLVVFVTPQAVDAAGNPLAQR
jgi:RNA polymerase sigma factor (sigma-70 family)